MRDFKIETLHQYAAVGADAKHSLEPDKLEKTGYLIKPVFDLVFAALAVAFFAPFMLVVAVLIYAQDRGPIFFVHERVGRGGRKFRCLKFRTMVTDSQARLDRLLAESPEARSEWEVQQKLRNDPRITGVGRFLRATSLDELPQFFNVLFGQMSVVGPRPIVDSEIAKYSSDFVAYASVKPGVTGLWQVMGRSDTSYSERVHLDVQYVNNMNFIMDLRIILKTISVVLNGRGAY